MKSNVGSSRGLFLSCLISQGVFVVSGITFLLIFCGIANSMESPESVIAPLSICALYLSSILCGLGAVKISGDGILSGLISGAMSACIVLILSALPLPTSGLSTGISILFTALIIPASVMGAFVGKKRKIKSKRYPNKRYRRN